MPVTLTIHCAKGVGAGCAGPTDLVVRAETASEAADRIPELLAGRDWVERGGEYFCPRHDPADEGEIARIGRDYSPLADTGFEARLAYWAGPGVVDPPRIPIEIRSIAAGRGRPGHGNPTADAPTAAPVPCDFTGLQGQEHCDLDARTHRHRALMNGGNTNESWFETVHYSDPDEIRRIAPERVDETGRQQHGAPAAPVIGGARLEAGPWLKGFTVRGTVTCMHGDCPGWTRSATFIGSDAPDLWHEVQHHMLDAHLGPLTARPDGAGAR